MDIDRDELFRVGYPLAMKFFNYRSRSMYESLMRDWFYDSVIDGLLKAVKLFDGRGRFDGFLFLILGQCWKQKREFMQRPQRDLTKQQRWTARETRTVATERDIGREVDRIDGRELWDRNRHRLTDWQRIALTAWMHGYSLTQLEKLLGRGKHTATESVQKGLRNLAKGVGKG